jgi:hypothetical protein
MKLRQHTIISITFSAFLFGISKSWIIFTASLLSGVLIDLDHVLDHLWEYRRPFSVKTLFDVCYNNRATFCMVIFHSWELLTLLNIYAFFISGNSWVIGITIGFTQHVVLDQIFIKPNKWTYFFYWRLKNNFNFKKMY